MNGRRQWEPCCPEMDASIVDVIARREVNERGVCRGTGWIKDLIIRAGENIAPAEIEHCLREHAAVADAVVYGVPDARLGERVAATIRLTPEAHTEVRTPAPAVSTG